MKKLALILLTLLLLHKLTYAVTYPSSPYISKAEYSEEEMLNPESEADVQQDPMLGGPPILPPDPGEMPIGDWYPLIAFAALYVIYKGRKVLLIKVKPEKK